MKRTLEIAATPAAFDILANKLYSNPRLAVLRELSTNANDAHIMKNNLEQNFVLHIPTPNDPYFRVRDFGTGLSIDEFEVIYFNFFVSTKQGDDSQTGNFGLGAKSPFACAKSFKVSSYQNGKKVTYLLESEEGVPTYEIIEEEETSEPDGLEIYIDDWKDEYKSGMYAWKQIANEFFKSTAFLPNANFTDDEYAKLLKVRPFYQKNSILFNSDDDDFTHGVTCNVAGVGFKVDLYECGEAGRELSNTLNSLRVNCLNIMAAKNDVTVTPSREELQYDAKTQKFVLDSVRTTLSQFDIAAHDTQELKYLASRLYNGYDANLIVKYFPITSAVIKNHFEKIEGYGFYTSMTFDKKNKWFEYQPANTKVRLLLNTNFSSRPMFIVDTNGITKTLEKSLNVIKENYDKFPVLICYYSSYGHQNNLRNFIMLPSQNPVATQKAFEKLTGYKADILKLNELTRWQPVAVASAPKDTASRKRLGWITAGALTSYKGKTGRGLPDFDLSGIKVAYIACEHNASDKQSTISDLQEYVDDDTFVVIRQGNSDWIAKQREAGIELTNFSDYKEKLINAAKPKLMEVALKNDLNNALGNCILPTELMAILANDSRIGEKDYFKTWKEMKQKAAVIHDAPYSIHCMVNYSDDPSLKSTVNAEKFGALQKEFMESNPVIQIIDTYQAKRHPELLIALLK